MKTYAPKPSDIERRWYVIDADGAVLGRLASEVAKILRGKHMPIFAPEIPGVDVARLRDASARLFDEDPKILAEAVAGVMACFGPLPPPSPAPRTATSSRGQSSGSARLIWWSDVGGSVAYRR